MIYLNFTLKVISVMLFENNNNKLLEIVHCLKSTLLYSKYNIQSWTELSGQSVNFE